MLSLRRSLPLLGAVAATAIVPSAALAAPKVSVFAKNIDNPRGLAIGPDGSLYAASAGKAGKQCQGKGDDAMCVGTTSKILAFKPDGTKRTVSGGLISIAGPGGFYATGADDVSVAPDGKVYTVTTSSTPKDTKGLPAPVRAAVGGLFEVTSGAPQKLAAIDAFEYANNPDKGKGAEAKNSNPYAVLALADRRIVADAGGNDLVSVADDGTVSLLAVLPKAGSRKAEPVPTSLALGPDGAVYVGELALGAGKKQASVIRVPLDGSAPSVYAAGFTAITGIAFGPDGSLYVTQFTADPTSESGPPSGSVVRVKPGGSRSRVASKLAFPAGTAVAADGTVYVSNYSVLPGKTPKKSPFKGAGGQILKITGIS